MELSESLQKKLDSLRERHEEVSSLLSQPEIVSDREKYASLSREFSELEPLILSFNAFSKLKIDLNENELMLSEADSELRDLVEMEIEDVKKQLQERFDELNVLLLPKDPNDKFNIFLEIRAGTGGDEAAIFSGDLFRMYFKYAEKQNWQVEILNERGGEHGGYKEIIARIEGKNVYSQLKFESGAHRVQRVPETESQGRIHTSACTVAILPEADQVSEIELEKKDLREDTFRASGAGGQHVNKTDSAIRLTHIPSGIVVECQDERSQHKNRARALSLLAAKLLDQEKTKREAEQAENRKRLVGSGDRSERIRTYNFPQGRLTDHRIGLTLYKLDEVLEGELDTVIEPLLREHQTNELQRISDETES